jgi:hypothetical protein
MAGEATKKAARIKRLMVKLQRLQRESPTAVELIGEWIERLVAGEPLESVKPEMDRVLALFQAKRKKP